MLQVGYMAAKNGKKLESKEKEREVRGVLIYVLPEEGISAQICK